MGGVCLNLKDEAAVRGAFQTIRSSVAEKAGAEHFGGVTVQAMAKVDGYEVIIGSSLDPQFGPVLLFGSGGQLVEVYKDRALALPPLNTTLARRLMEQTKIFKALQGVRGRKAVDLAALEQLLVRFSQLVVEQRWIKEIDINPLLASSDRLLALDARIVVHPPETAEADLPKTAVRPYPLQYASSWRTKQAMDVLIRPIRPEDEPLLVQFHEGLSERSVYLRYFRMLKLSQRVTHERLTRICYIDYDREMALVAEHTDTKTGAREILAVARLTKIHGSTAAEFAVLITDRFHHQGLGTELLRRLIAVARDEGIALIVGDILPENRDMVELCTKVGFRCEYSEKDEVVKAEMRV